MSENTNNIKADDLTHEERVSLLERGKYLIINGQIIAHKDALEALSNPPATPPGQQKSQDKATVVIPKQTDAH